MLKILLRQKIPYKEIWAQDYLDKSNIKFETLKNVVEHSEIILYQYKLLMILCTRVLLEFLRKELILIFLFEDRYEKTFR